jgi:DNA end-binding protein Ku
MPALMETRAPQPTRVTLRPHDPATGEEIDKREVVKGYEYARGEFVTFTAEELKALDVESSKVIDLEKPRDDLDPVYFDSSYLDPLDSRTLERFPAPFDFL